MSRDPFSRASFRYEIYLYLNNFIDDENLRISDVEPLQMVIKTRNQHTFCEILLSFYITSHFKGYHTTESIIDLHYS